MAVVRKTIASVGTHHSPDGVVVVTPERAQHWHESMMAMIADGIRVPVPWGHRLSALPVEDADDEGEAFLSSRYNAGYVVGAELSAGGLDVLIDAPGLRESDGNLVTTAELSDGRRVETAISEVSPFIGEAWTDGKGRTWGDAIMHVALTPLPVWHGQPGFAALGTAKVKGFYLGTGMANRDDEPIEKPKKKLDLDGDGDADANDEKLADDLMVDSEETGDPVLDDATTTPETNDPTTDMVSRIRGTLTKLGVPMPEGDDSDHMKFLEHLDVALTVLSGKMDMDAEKTTPQTANPQAAQAPVREVAPPGSAMLSTVRGNPVLRELILQQERDQKRKRLERLDALKRRGLSVAEANKIAAAAVSVRLSADPKSGKFVRPEVDRQLDLLERVLPAEGTGWAALSTAKPVPAPSVPEAEEMVVHKASGLKMPKSMHEEVLRLAKR